MGDMKGEEKRGERKARTASVWGAVRGGEEVVSPYASIRRTDDQVWRITQKGSRSRRSQFRHRVGEGACPSVPGLSRTENGVSCTSRDMSGVRWAVSCFVLQRGSAKEI